MNQPRLLRQLLRDSVPGEKGHVDYWKLEHVITTVQTHRLLSESSPPSTPQDVIDGWKSAIDSWLNRLLPLASSTMPDKCWAGICLLGVTCQECSSERFLASYSDWFHKFITSMQSPAATHTLKVASCASLSDLLKRLARYPNEKKDGNSHATKLIQPILKLLNEDNSEVVWEEATCLLLTIINAFPSSIQRHYDTVEAAITLKLMSEKCNDNLLEKLGHVLSLLPKSRGDSESWMVMMQKILLLICDQLDDAFQSFEEGSKRNKVKNLLLPPGKEPPPPLGGTVVQGVHLAKRPELLLMSRISTLIGCCCHLLTNSYPVQVSVPVGALLALVERVLMVDGSSSPAFPSTMKLEIIFSKLHLLQLDSLELLSSIIQGLSSLLLPHVAFIIQLLSVYFKGCKLPELRIKVYSIYRDLLRSMGVGVVVYLAKVITGNEDLGSIDSANGVLSSNVNSASAEAQSQPYQKKRKQAVRSASLTQQSDRVELNVDPALDLPTVSVKIAALEALEALLIVGGSFRSKDWRSDIDTLLADVAIKACKDGFVKDKQFSFYRVKNNSACTDFQLAALRAFLASLVSPGLVHPRYLGPGLELFRRGLQEGGARVAEFCARSLSTLQAIIHPRSCPPVDFQKYDASREFPDKMYSNDHAWNPVYHSTKLEKAQHEAVSVFEDPLQSLLQSDDEMENHQADVTTVNWPIEACKISASGNHPEVLKIPEGSEAGVSAAATAKRVATEQFGGDYSLKGATTTLVSGVETTVSSGIVQSKGDDALCPTNDMQVANNVINYECGETAKESHIDTSKKFGFAMDYQSDVDSIPDIVDGDPDSDLDLDMDFH